MYEWIDPWALKERAEKLEEKLIEAIKDANPAYPAPGPYATLHEHFSD